MARSFMTLLFLYVSNYMELGVDLYVPVPFASNVVSVVFLVENISCQKIQYICDILKQFREIGLLI